MAFYTRKFFFQIFVHKYACVEYKPYLTQIERPCQCQQLQLSSEKTGQYRLWLHQKHLAGDNNMRNHGNKLNCFFPPRNGPSRKSKLISKLKITSIQLYILTTYMYESPTWSVIAIIITIMSSALTQCSVIFEKKLRINGRQMKVISFDQNKVIKTN